MKRLIIVSAPKKRIAVVVDDAGAIHSVSPSAKAFIGQHIYQLERWMSRTFGKTKREDLGELANGQ